jgi:hypothetical protein
MDCTTGTYCTVSTEASNIPSSILSSVHLSVGRAQKSAVERAAYYPPSASGMGKGLSPMLNPKRASKSSARDRRITYLYTYSTLAIKDDALEASWNLGIIPSVLGNQPWSLRIQPASFRRLYIGIGESVTLSAVYFFKRTPLLPASDSNTRNFRAVRTSRLQTPQAAI